MYGKIQAHLQQELEDIKENGLFKKERIITSPQGAVITISTGAEVIFWLLGIIFELSILTDWILSCADNIHGINNNIRREFFKNVNNFDQLSY